MNRIGYFGVAAAVTMILSGGIALARPAGAFGFGPPPSYPEIRELVGQYFALNLKDPDSAKGIVISRPVAACHGRGHPGKRDVCGYQFCVTLNAANSFGGYTGRKVLVFWKYQGFPPEAVENQGLCPSIFDAWVGDPPVTVRDFCQVQPKNTDCLAGKRETFTELSLEESMGKSESGVDEPKLCDDAFKDRLRQKGMSYTDIDAVCSK